MKQRNKRVIPGFGISMGITVTILSLVVLIPLASGNDYRSFKSFDNIDGFEKAFVRPEFVRITKSDHIEKFPVSGLLMTAAQHLRDFLQPEMLQAVLLKNM